MSEIGRSTIIKICGNPQDISLILNYLDSANANNLYPRKCLDTDHFEDATVAMNISTSSVITLISVTGGNIRGAL